MNCQTGDKRAQQRREAWGNMRKMNNFFSSAKVAQKPEPKQPPRKKQATLDQTTTNTVICRSRNSMDFAVCE